MRYRIIEGGQQVGTASTADEAAEVVKSLRAGRPHLSFRFERIQPLPVADDYEPRTAVDGAMVEGWGILKRGIGRVLDALDSRR